MKGCIPVTIKTLLVGVNAIVLFTGLVVLGFSVYGMVDTTGFEKLVIDGAEALGEDISINLYSSAFTVLVIFSSVVVVVSFLGCCGAWKENRFLLFLYYALLLAVFVGTVVGATLASTGSMAALKRPLLKSMAKYDPDTTDPAIEELNAAWDQMQADVSCCGVNNYLDWQNANTSKVYPDKLNHLVPASCCSGFSGQDLENCRKQPGNQEYSSSMNGCFADFQATIENNKSNIQIGSVAVTGFLFVNLMVLFGFALSLMPNDDYERV